jgi:hypothetical protein
MKMENLQMVSRSLGIFAVMVFALQSVDPAGAACQSVEGAVCGGTGNGSISSVTGNVSLAQGGRVLRATSGAGVSPGARILAGEGGVAQVNLGAGCFTSVAPNSIATFTSRSGLTCLRQNERFTAQTENNPFDNNALIAAGIGVVLIGVVVGVGIAGSSNNSVSP